MGLRGRLDRKLVAKHTGNSPRPLFGGQHEDAAGCACFRGADRDGASHIFLIASLQRLIDGRLGNEGERVGIRAQLAIQIGEIVKQVIERFTVTVVVESFSQGLQLRQLIG